MQEFNWKIWLKLNKNDIPYMANEFGNFAHFRELPEINRSI